MIFELCACKMKTIGSTFRPDSMTHTQLAVAGPLQLTSQGGAGVPCGDLEVHRACQVNVRLISDK